MNALLGEVVSFDEADAISLVRVKTALGDFSVLMLNFSKSLCAKKGGEVELLFKENELSLALKGAKTSVDNSFESKIISIDKGKMLWQVFLESNLSAIISAKAGETLNLRANDEVVCFVKADDIIIKVL